MRTVRTGERLRMAAALALLVPLAACTAEQFGLPRRPLSVEAPDGQSVAFVRNHPEIDPPNQSIWLESPGESPRRIEKLGPDQDWCDVIVWSQDSSTVAFLIQGARLRVVHVPTGETVFNDWIVERHGEYPAAVQVHDLALDDSGRQVSFRGCRRGGECLPTQTLGLPQPAEA